VVRESDYYLQMDGPRVFQLAVERMSTVSREVARKGGVGIDEIDYVVPHQANQRIFNAIALRLGVDRAKVLSNIAELGNTAAASIPILLAESAANGRIEQGHRLLLVAFGGGLTWGASMVTWPGISPDIGVLAGGPEI
jgi:3-oxoacyl-[acyl-carrier-protein] synthase III